MKHLRFPQAIKRVAQKFHFAILRIEVTRSSRGLSAIAELLVTTGARHNNAAYVGLNQSRAGLGFGLQSSLDIGSTLICGPEVLGFGRTPKSLLSPPSMLSWQNALFRSKRSPTVTGQSP